jgi:hypothetical protein
MEGGSGKGGTRADIIQIDTALESMRDSGFDLTAAVGEPIDNSIEAGASSIRVQAIYDANRNSIQEVVIADNGVGIDSAIVAHVLSMGYSTRYGQRGSLGRFGVGLKLAGLSLGRRIDIYTRQRDSAAIWHAYLDLEEVAKGRQTHIVARMVEEWPAEHADAMRGSDGDFVKSGTLVTYGKVDRLTAGGSYGTSLDQKLSELRTFIARAYRKFLEKGLRIELNGANVTLLDPLFLMDNPRIIQRYKPEDLRGTMIDTEEVEIANGQKITVTVSIPPVQFRWKEGDGGNRDSQGKDIREFQIADSAGKISMLRNGREINYDLVAKLLPSGVNKVDRYIGIEVAFPATLDEFFQVRNVKRGAVPVDKLRDVLREWLKRPVRQARKEIRAQWATMKIQKAREAEHKEAMAAAARAEQTAPKGQAGRNLTAEQTEQVIREILEDLGVQDDAQKSAEIREDIQEYPFSLLDGSWPGKEMFEITHLNGKGVVLINHRHPFIRDIYDALKDAGNGNVDDRTPEELADLARRVQQGIEVLFLAYAKSENLHPDPAIFDDLRSYWGQFTQSYLRELPTED